MVGTRSARSKDNSPVKIPSDSESAEKPSDESQNLPEISKSVEIEPTEESKQPTSTSPTKRTARKSVPASHQKDENEFEMTIVCKVCDIEFNSLPEFIQHKESSCSSKSTSSSADFLAPLGLVRKDEQTRKAVTRSVNLLGPRRSGRKRVRKVPRDFTPDSPFRKRKYENKTITENPDAAHSSETLPKITQPEPSESYSTESPGRIESEQQTEIINVTKTDSESDAGVTMQTTQGEDSDKEKVVLVDESGNTEVVEISNEEVKVINEDGESLQKTKNKPPQIMQPRKKVVKTKKMKNVSTQCGEESITPKTRRKRKKTVPSKNLSLATLVKVHVVKPKHLFPKVLLPTQHPIKPDNEEVLGVAQIVTPEIIPNDCKDEYVSYQVTRLTYSTLIRPVNAIKLKTQLALPDICSISKYKMRNNIDPLNPIPSGDLIQFTDDFPLINMDAPRHGGKLMITYVLQFVTGDHKEVKMTLRRHGLNRCSKSFQRRKGATQLLKPNQTAESDSAGTSKKGEKSAAAVITIGTESGQITITNPKDVATAEIAAGGDKLVRKDKTPAWGPTELAWRTNHLDIKEEDRIIKINRPKGCASHSFLDESDFFDHDSSLYEHLQGKGYVLRPRRTEGTKLTRADIKESGACDWVMLKCKICDSSYSCLKTLINHMSNQHSTKKVYYPCCFCPCAYAQHKNVSRHILKHHYKSKEFVDKMRIFIHSQSFIKQKTSIGDTEEERRESSRIDTLFEQSIREPMSVDMTSREKYTSLSDDEFLERYGRDPLTFAGNRPGRPMKDPKTAMKNAICFQCKLCDASLSSAALVIRHYKIAHGYVHSQLVKLKLELQSKTDEIIGDMEKERIEEQEQMKIEEAAYEAKKIKICRSVKSSADFIDLEETNIRTFTYTAGSIGLTKPSTNENSVFFNPEISKSTPTQVTTNKTIAGTQQKTFFVPVVPVSASEGRTLLHAMKLVTPSPNKNPEIIQITPSGGKIVSTPANTVRVVKSFIPSKPVGSNVVTVMQGSSGGGTNTAGTVLVYRCEDCGVSTSSLEDHQRTCQKTERKEAVEYISEITLRTEANESTLLVNDETPSDTKLTNPENLD